jgi:hypothetical protein
MKKDEITNNVLELLEAKDAVLTCLNDPDIIVGMRGLSYWADRVETLRKELRNNL